MFVVTVSLMLVGMAGVVTLSGLVAWSLVSDYMNDRL